MSSALEKTSFRLERVELEQPQPKLAEDEKKSRPKQVLGCRNAVNFVVRSNCQELSISKVDRNSSTMAAPYDPTSFYIGLSLAISSTFFIGSSFIIKKKALLHINRLGGLRAGSGGFGYLRDWLWWAGLLTMGIGEAANFAAYAFAPASLVTPLGALSVLVSAVLASYFLNEKLNFLGKLGCLLCILGSTVIVIHSPQEIEVENLEELLMKLQAPSFLVYIATVIGFALILACYVGPIYGHHNVVVYILLCSSVGSLTVMGCKGLGLALKETISGTHNELNNWLTWTFLIAVIICIMVQMNYLNRALDLFNTGIVTPVYYVFFTTFVIAASLILFREWQSMSAADILGSVSGFLIVIVAIVLLNTFKDIDLNVTDIRGMMRPKRELIGSGILHGNEEDPISRHSLRKSSYGSPDFTNTI